MLQLPTLYVSHGGGPWPWVDGLRQSHANLEAFLVAAPHRIGTRPAAVLAVSAHWEAPAFTAMSAPAPPMLYDYYGFPENAYHVNYPAPGAPALARRVQALIESAGLPAALDAERGFDHGTFVPLAVMYPAADVPVLQLSIRADYDPAAHLALGRALAPLRREGVLILASGFSWHNLRLMSPAAQDPSRRFDDWLQETVLASSPEERTRRLLDWSAAPAARIAHPREDHLIPLMVAVGAAESEDALLVHHDEDFFGGVVASSFQFGATG
jgi:aromatic ring-opening dioxygenase catalytic subunit (LigB family)